MRSAATLTAAVSVTLAVGGTLALGGTPAVGAPPALHALTRSAAVRDITAAFLAIHPRGSSARFPTGRALVSAIDRARPGLARLFVGAHVGTDGHIGVGLTSADHFVAICRLTGQRELIVRATRSGEASVTTV